MNIKVTCMYYRKYRKIWASLVAQQLRICLQCRSFRRCRFDPWVSKISWRKAWQPTLVFCLGNPMDRGLHGVANSWTWLKRLSMHAHTEKYKGNKNPSIISSRGKSEYFGMFLPGLSCCSFFFFLEKLPYNVLFPDFLLAVSWTFPHDIDYFFVKMILMVL